MARPKGRTARGEQTADRLYEAAIQRISADGYDKATLRQIAADAEVSPGLLYKYFPSKQAVVMTLYARASASFAEQGRGLSDGSWPERVIAATRLSLQTLAPHRDTLSAVLPALLGDSEGGLLSPQSAPARRDVTGVFVSAVTESSRPPRVAEAMGRVAYLLQLGVILWWLLDRTAEQRATDGLLALLSRMLPLLALALRVPGAGGFITELDRLASEGLYGESLSAGD